MLLFFFVGVPLLLGALGYLAFARLTPQGAHQPILSSPEQETAAAAIPPKTPIARKPLANAPALSFIIPARNEAHNLPKLLTSLIPQLGPSDECLVVDDHSSDDTAAAARRLGARVLQSAPLPPNTMGKPHALIQGAQAAKNPVLVFLDADLEVAPQAVARFRSLAQTYEVFSILPDHQVPQPYEQLSLAFNAVMAAGVGLGEPYWLGKHFPSKAFVGQFLGIHKHVYERLGTYEAVKREILENMALAKRAQDVSSICMLGRGLVSMRMYPSGLKNLIQGWLKAATRGAHHTPKHRMLLISLWLTGAMGASIGAFLSFRYPQDLPFQAGTALVYVFYVWQFRRIAKSLGTYRAWTWHAFFIPLWFYQAVFLSALVREKLGITPTWKGRRV